MSVCECLPVSVVCVCECIKICRNFLNDREIIMMPQVFVSFCHSKLRSLASRTLRGNGVLCPERRRERGWGIWRGLYVARVTVLVLKCRASVAYF